MKLRVGYDGTRYTVQYKSFLFWHILREGWRNWHDYSFYKDFCWNDKMTFETFEHAYNEAETFKFKFARSSKKTAYHVLDKNKIDWRLHG
jgi:hypothetical protein